jgi:hypothetical protein
LPQVTLKVINHLPLGFLDKAEAPVITGNPGRDTDT